MITSKSDYAKSFCKNNQKVYQIKVSLSVKIKVVLTFMCSIIKIFHLKYCPVCNV